MKVKVEGLDSFENRFIAALALGGVTELGLAISPLGPVIGHHLQTFGYLGIGALLIAGYHKLLQLMQRRK